MKAAVTTENQEVFQHFGKCQTFTLAVIENNQILSKSLLDAQGNGHSALVGLLQAQGVDTLVCGGIGQGAVVHFIGGRYSSDPRLSGQSIDDSRTVGPRFIKR